MREAEAERQAEAARNFFFFFPRSGDFGCGKGAWLGSRQNPTKKSGGLDKTDYERLIRLVSQNNSP